MSRIRSIHPGLWTDEAFVSLSPMARLFLMGLWNECDDMGSFTWSPLGLKMKLLPADAVDASALLNEVIEAGCIMRYEVGGKSFGAVRNFCQYQRPKKPNSVHPQTDEVRNWVNTNARSTRDGSEPMGNQLPTDGEKSRQMEDGGDKMEEEDCSDEQSQAAQKRGGMRSLIPSDWKAPLLADLPPKSRACAEQWTPESYDTEAEAFVCYWRSERKMKADWGGTWANRIVQRHSAIMRDQKFGNAAPTTPKAPVPVDWEERAKFYDRLGRSDDAADCRRKAVSIGQIPGKIMRSQSIGAH